MDPVLLLFLSSGLLLGWSLGANDAANVFGTAVGSRMIRFRTAATLCSLFLLAGAVVSGAGAAHGLGKLGSVNALGGSFTVCLCAGLTVLWMTRVGLPVSTTQAIVGAILGWNWFTGSLTDRDTLLKIASTWVACPALAAVFSACLYRLLVLLIRLRPPHMLSLDRNTRLGLLLAGILGSYALGANNIGNVMGVFVDSSPFTAVRMGSFTFTAVQQLFLLGALAIALGVFTYSRQVMLSVGRNLVPLSPLAAFVVVVSHSMVLVLFSSRTLEELLLRQGLPPIPLIPVSSSQAVIGAVIGIALSRGLTGLQLVQWRTLAGVAGGWIVTPIAAGLGCFVLLFFVQNVFNQRVQVPREHVIDADVLDHLERTGTLRGGVGSLRDRVIEGELTFLRALHEERPLPRRVELEVLQAARLVPTSIDSARFERLDTLYLSDEDIEAILSLQGMTFRHRWQLEEALADASPAWRREKDTPLLRIRNKKIDEKLDYLCRFFRITEKEW